MICKCPPDAVFHDIVVTAVEDIEDNERLKPPSSIRSAKVIRLKLTTASFTQHYHGETKPASPVFDPSGVTEPERSRGHSVVLWRDAEKGSSHAHDCV